jgi:hypothetical protein
MIIVLILGVIIYIISAIQAYRYIREMYKSFLIDSAPTQFLEWLIVFVPIVNTIEVIMVCYRKGYHYYLKHKK